MTSAEGTPKTTAPTVKGMSLILMWPLALDIEPDDLVRTASTNGIDAVGDKSRKTIEALLQSEEWVEVLDPLRHVDTDHDGKENSKKAEFIYQEFVYFHRYVQRFLYGFDRTEPADRPMRVLRRNDIAAMVVTFKSLKVTLSVDRLRFHIFDAGAAVLVTEVSLDPANPVKTRAEVKADWDERPLTLDDILTIQNGLRRAYTPYWIEETPQETPLSVCWIGRKGVAVKSHSARSLTDSLDLVPRHGTPSDVSAPVQDWWTFILKNIDIEPEKAREGVPCWRHISDDRMMTMLWLSLDHPGDVSPKDWVRLAYADGPNDGFPYARRFLCHEKDGLFYDRFWDPKRGSDMLATRFLIRGYHFAMVGSGVPDNKGFVFFDAILKQHFRRHYAQIGLIVQFQFAALLATSNAISHAVARFSETNDEARFSAAIKAIRERHLTFTHRYWFTGVSNQIQAREIFERWQGALGLDTLYREVDAELASATGFLDAKAQERSAQAGIRLNVIAAVGLIFSMALGALGANVLIGDWAGGPDAVASLWGSARGWGVALIVLGVFGSAGGLFLRWIMPRNVGQEMPGRVAGGLILFSAVSLIVGFFRLVSAGGS